MAAFVALLAVAAISWLFPDSFTAAIGEHRLPHTLRSRLDAVGPAAFAALLATELAGAPPPVAPALLAALAAAGLAARRTGNHLVAVLAAAATWSLVSLVTSV